MKTELRLVPHAVLPGQNTIEIWFNGRLMGAVYGSDNHAGVRVISKHQMMTTCPPSDNLGLNVTEVTIDP